MRDFVVGGIISVCESSKSLRRCRRSVLSFDDGGEGSISCGEEVVVIFCALRGGTSVGVGGGVLCSGVVCIVSCVLSSGVSMILCLRLGLGGKCKCKRKTPKRRTTPRTGGTPSSSNKR